jgi:hypothetical protein
LADTCEIDATAVIGLNVKPNNSMRKKSTFDIVFT